MPHSGPSFHASLSSAGVSGIRKDFEEKRQEEAECYYSSSPTSGKLPVDEELLVPCSAARQGHGSHGELCSKETSIAEMCDEQRARSAGKRGRSWNEHP